jgi:hypothetical protein
MGGVILIGVLADQQLKAYREYKAASRDSEGAVAKKPSLLAK